MLTHTPNKEILSLHLHLQPQGHGKPQHVKRSSLTYKQNQYQKRLPEELTLAGMVAGTEIAGVSVIFMLN